MARGEWGAVNWVAMSNWSHPAGATHEWVTLAECQHCGSGDVAVMDGSRRVGRCRLGGDVELVAPGRSDPLYFSGGGNWAWFTNPSHSGWSQGMSG